MADIEIGYKGSTITSINSGGVTTLNTIGTFCEDNITVTFNKTQGEVFTPATTITTNPSITLSATTGTITAFYSGASNITPTVTPGYVSAGTAGTVRTSGTSTYQLSTVAAQTITPTTASQLAVASGRFTTGSVYVGAIPSTYVQPTGTLTISTNGTYDVTEYASVSTNISEGERFAPIYKRLAYNSVLYASGSSEASYTASDISDWCNSLSYIFAIQLAGRRFSGQFTFTNVSHIDAYAFGWPYAGAIGNDPIYHQQYHPTFCFPSCVSMDVGIFANKNGAFDVEFGSNLISIASYAFYRCVLTLNSTTSYTLPSVSTVGSYAFYYCGNVSTLNLPACKSIEASAFYSCRSLSTISLPVCETIASYAFYSCSALSTISLPTCTDIGASAFAYCKTLSTISLPVCTRIRGGAFYGCSVLGVINLPMCLSIGQGAFSGCSALSMISLPVCTHLEASAFYGCSELTIVNLPKCVSIGMWGFGYCINLNTVILPECSYINGSAFTRCYHLLSLYLLSQSIVSLVNTSAFMSTPISTYTTSTGGVYGSIFVRASLYDSYLTATNWSRYSSRFVSLTDAEIEALGF